MSLRARVRPHHSSVDATRASLLHFVIISFIRNIIETVVSGKIIKTLLIPFSKTAKSTFFEITIVEKVFFLGLTRFFKKIMCQTLKLVLTSCLCTRLFGNSQIYVLVFNFFLVSEPSKIPKMTPLGNCFWQ